MPDPYSNDVDMFSLPGHDRDCARAMLNQARGRGGISDVQVAHLLRIGWTAGRVSMRGRDKEALLCAANGVEALRGWRRIVTVGWVARYLRGLTRDLPDPELRWVNRHDQERVPVQAEEGDRG